MEGVIANFRCGRHTKSENQMVIVVKGIDKKEKTDKFIGKEISWKSPAGKEIKGKITSSHGNKGALRVLFEKGMPGQAIGQKVEIN